MSPAMRGLVSRRLRGASAIRRASDPHAKAQEVMRAAGAGAFLGAWYEDGGPVVAPARGALNVLGGPGSGKSTAIVAPSVMLHPGPVVSTSTKREILETSLPARTRVGEAWVFDVGGEGVPPGVTELRWSPLRRSRDWLGAQIVADAMVAAANAGERAERHWLERAGALLAVLFHAAARAELGMEEVIGWVLRHDLLAPREHLESGSLAAASLEGFERTHDRERAAILSTASGALRAYRSPAALRASSDPEPGAAARRFDAAEFVRSAADTVYLVAPSHQQQLVAPVIVGLLTDVRHAVYEYSGEIRSGSGEERLWPPVLWALDECANVAPIHDLPAILSESGGQGLQVMTVFQDIGQVRRRWPEEASGFLSLFTTVAVLPGIRDRETLELLSTLIGQYDREVETQSRSEGQTYDPFSIVPLPTSKRRERGQSTTTRREAVIPPERIAQLGAGEALLLVGPRWQLVRVKRWFEQPALRALRGPE